MWRCTRGWPTATADRVNRAEQSSTRRYYGDTWESLLELLDNTLAAITYWELRVKIHHTFGVRRNLRCDIFQNFPLAIGRPRSSEDRVRWHSNRPRSRRTSAYRNARPRSPIDLPNRSGYIPIPTDSAAGRICAEGLSERLGIIAAGIVDQYWRISSKHVVRLL